MPLIGTDRRVRARPPGYGSVAYTGFFSAQVFLNLLIDNAFLCIVGVGMTFVILSGGIDLSVGSVIALTTMVSAALVEQPTGARGRRSRWCWRSAAAFGALMGWLIERFRLQPFIVTLAGMFLARGLCYLISIDSISITDPIYAAISQRASRSAAAPRSPSARCSRWSWSRSASGSRTPPSSAAPSTRSAATRRRRC